MNNIFQKSESMTPDPSPAPWRLFLLTAVLFVAIFIEDLLLPLGVAAGVPYVAVVLLGWWFPKRNHIIILAAIATALTLIGYFYSPEGGIHWVVAANRFFALFAICASAVLLIKAKESEEKVESINEKLEQQVEERTEKLRASEERFRRAIVDAPNPIMIHAEDGEVLMISQQWTELSGYTHAEIPTIAEWTEKAYGKGGIIEELRERIGALYDIEEKKGEGEYYITTKSGELRTWDFRSSPQGKLPDGRSVVISMAVDVTERKRAEEARETLSQAVETVPVGIALFDSDDKLVFFNARYGELMESIADILKPGVSFEKIIRTIVDRKPVKDARGREEEFIQKRIRHHQNPIGPFDIRREDKWLVANESHLSDGSIFTILTDVTEQKQAENALHERDERLRGAVESMQEGFALFDADDHLVAFNKEYQRLRPMAQEIVDRGGTFEDMIRANVKAGHILEAKGREEEFIKERLESHRNPKGPMLRRFADGKWYMLNETHTPEGGTALSFIDVTEQKQTEIALKESKERFQSVIDNSPSFISLKDKDGRFQLINQKHIDIFGLEFQDILGKSSFDLHPKKIAEKFFTHDQKVIETKSAITEERQIATKQGTRDFLVTKFPILDGSGDVVRIGTIGTDISERKKIEEALSDSEARLKDLYDNAPDMYCSVDAKTAKIVQCNDTLAANLGLHKDEIVGWPVFYLYHDDCLDEAKDCFHAFTTTGKAESNDLKLKRKDGSTIDVSLRVTAVRDEKGNVTYSRSVWRDISAYKRAEEAAFESQARLSGILNIAPEAVITVGSDMNIQLFNQGAERVFGYKADEVLGQPLERLIPAYLRDSHRKHVEEFDGSKDTYRLIGQRQEIIGLRKDGTEFPASASVSKLEIGGEKLFTVMMQDITESKRSHDTMMAAKREAETANHAKSEFLAAMSHEFRTPLNAILGFADILTNQYFGPLGDDKYREYAEDIQASGEHLLTLVNEILDLSTIEAGKQSLAREKLSTMELVMECERIVEERARSNGIDLVTEIPKDLPPLYADRRASKQILLNLLSNAIKFTPEGGKITVSATASKKNITLKVADTGKGIPAEKLPELTDPFNRAGGDSYLTEKGWGLGLTITKSLVDLHDGTLKIESKVDKGTTVMVSFPNGAP